ncbi:MAG: hypothetical protein Q7U20_02995 [Caulobacter sp.]|nr:hypothetical protein [Caulobacter sp.]
MTIAGATGLVLNSLFELGVQQSATSLLRGAAARLNAGKLDPNHEISRAARRAHLRACVYLLREARQEVEPSTGGLLSSVRGLWSSSPFNRANAELLRRLKACEKETAEEIESRWPQGGYDAVETAMDQLLAAEKGDWRRARDANAEAMTGQALEEVRQAGGWDAVPEAVTQRFRHPKTGWPAAFASFLAVEVKRNDNFFRIHAALMQAETLAEVKSLRADLGRRLVGDGSIAVFEGLADAFREQSEKLDALLEGQAGLQESVDELPDAVAERIKSLFGESIPSTRGKPERPATAELMTGLRWSGERWPAPRVGEPWHQVAVVRTPREWTGPFHFTRPNINLACWAKDRLYILASHDLSWWAETRVRLFVGRLHDPEAREHYNFKQYRKLLPGASLRAVQPVSANSIDFIVSDTRRLSLWQPSQLEGYPVCYDVIEFRPDGTAEWYEISDSTKTPFEDTQSDHRSGDFYHDLYQLIGLSPDRKYLASYRGRLPAGNSDHSDWRLVLWKADKHSARQGGLVGEIVIPGDPPFPRGLSWSPSSRLVSLLFEDEAILARSDDATRFDLKPQVGWKFVDRCAWHPSRDVIAIPTFENEGYPNNAWRIDIFDATSGERIARRDVGNKGTILGIDWSPEGRYIAVSTYDRTLVVWDLLTDQTRETAIIGKTGEPHHLEFSPDGQRLACSGYHASQEALIWDHTTGEELMRCAGRLMHASSFAGSRLPSRAWHPDGARIAVQTDSSSITVWRVGA